MSCGEPPSFEELQEIADYDGLLSHMELLEPMNKARETGSFKDLKRAELKIMELLKKNPPHSLPHNEEKWVSAGANLMLKDILENPFKPLSERYEDFQNEYQGNKRKDELVEHGLVVERHIRVEPLKRKLLQVTKKGRNYVKNQVRMEWKPRQGRGGIVHQFWQRHIRNVFEEKEWRTELEDRDADVSAVKGNNVLAIEVAMEDKPREIRHVRKHLVEFDKILVAARNKDLKAGLHERLDENGLLNDRVIVRRFTDLVEPEKLPVK